MIFRNYQQSIYEQTINTSKDVVIQLDTGGGKTPIIARLATHEPTVCVAHRNMLVEQISGTLSKMSVSHQIIATKLISNRCKLIQQQYKVTYSGDVYVASIQSLISWFKRGKLDIDRFAIKQIIIDETHHVAENNMWTELKVIFPNARFIGPTATPCRLDGKGLHKECGGLYEELIQAEQLKENSTEWLISNGYLSDYEYWCPPSDSIHYDKLKYNALSDFSKESLDEAVNIKILSGEAIYHYEKLAKGKRTLIYCSSIEHAETITKKFRSKRYKTSYIASSLTLSENMRRIDAFRNGNIDILINVEMVTEGFDLPEIECVIMLRMTRSFGLFRQMCGRNLRPKKNNAKAIFIDHVNNVTIHGLPDDAVEWSLYGTPKNKSEPVIPCDRCGFIHNAYLAECPECGFENWVAVEAKEKDKKAYITLGIELVKKIREHLKQQVLDEQLKQAELQRQHELNTVIQKPVWINHYQPNAIGLLCVKLAKWFAENLKETDVNISEINKFMLGSRPEITFWSSNFTINDLKSNNPDKCKKVFEKWQSN